VARRVLALLVEAIRGASEMLAMIDTRVVQYAKL
jgi:hypothetical protein